MSETLGLIYIKLTWVYRQLQNFHNKKPFSDVMQQTCSFTVYYLIMY
uniref:Uncharacterized protein n=1 Tax=Dendroctonus ponderosae TaxID=77166 RepID=J3JYX5_DENPD|nr:unknown [Dendroctonus ponderosae]